MGPFPYLGMEFGSKKLRTRTNLGGIGHKHAAV